MGLSQDFKWLSQSLLSQKQGWNFRNMQNFTPLSKCCKQIVKSLLKSLISQCTALSRPNIYLIITVRALYNNLKGHSVYSRDKFRPCETNFPLSLFKEGAFSSENSIEIIQLYCPSIQLKICKGTELLPWKSSRTEEQAKEKFSSLTHSLCKTSLQSALRVRKCWPWLCIPSGEGGSVITALHPAVLWAMAAGRETAEPWPVRAA